MQVTQRGMTLLETLLAMVVVAVGMFAAAALHMQALQATQDARQQVQAVLASASAHEQALP
ncbi:prepilin-type N-terminal cleavage/methylation domain-containing protein [Pseudomonas fulva]|uniref:type IV pilus modification PilV family protein n=1 Tax=Pseudomonas fulva TaxID=47880 RepID=UPI0018AA4F25|nr:prepilin-type N-terminal cleavage/methylation domain-containing protein [Pseudomonas fulva]MBF8776993.1 prepilin-type N-terminal cleavage/methylation domain-containing protein [Pseudomonas fulva]